MKTYSITNDHLTMTVSNLGASIIEFSTIELPFPILRPVKLSPNFDASQSALYPLVPFANRIRNNSFLWQGKLVKWPKHSLDNVFFLHGDGWLKTWSCIEQSANQLIFILDSNIDDICHYQSVISYRLQDKQLSVELSLKNKGEKIFPFGLGLHPFFTRLPNTQIQFSATGLWLEDDQYLPTDFISPVPNQFSCNKKRVIPEIWINNSYTNWSGIVTLQHENGVNITMMSDCSVLQVFKFADNELYAQNDSFICLEPQSHVVNDHNNFNYGLLRMLEPEQSTQMWMKIAID